MEHPGPKDRRWASLLVGQVEQGRKGGGEKGTGGQPDRTRVTVEGELKDGQSCPLVDWNLFALVTANPCGG